jgi:hypothetical protein
MANGPRSDEKTSLGLYFLTIDSEITELVQFIIPQVSFKESNT